MPPKAIKSIRDLIFWQYAKIISQSAGFGKGNYGFIMNRFKKLKSGDITWSSSIREWIRENEQRDVCNYCGKREENLTIEHILPLSRGGPDHPDNTVWICKECNLKKSMKRLYEYFTLDMRDEIPRIAEGKYLKLLYDLHSNTGSLDIDDITNLCPHCDLESECEEYGTVEQLSVYCLEGIFKDRFSIDEIQKTFQRGTLDKWF